MNFKNLEGCKVTLLLEAGFTSTYGILKGSNANGIFLEQSDSYEFFPFTSIQRIIVKKEILNALESLHEQAIEHFNK